MAAADNYHVGGFHDDRQKSFGRLRLIVLVASLIVRLASLVVLRSASFGRLRLAVRRAAHVVRLAAPDRSSFGRLRCIAAPNRSSLDDGKDRAIRIGMIAKRHEDLEAWQLANELKEARVAPARKLAVRAIQVSKRFIVYLKNCKRNPPYW